MKGTKLLWSFWLASAAFCVLQITFGPEGFLAMDRLRDHQVRLETRLEALKAENARLTARYEALRTSPDEVRLEARSLGFFLPGDIPVRTLDGAEFRLPSEAPDFSTVEAWAGGTVDSSFFFRIAWPLLFVLFYTFFSLAELLVPVLGRPRSSEEGTSGGNLPVAFQTRLDFFRK